MTNRSSTQRQIEQHLQLWIYFLPVVGVIPAIWTLYRTHDINNVNNSSQEKSQSTLSLRQRQKASRLAINLVLIWLSSYALFTLGANNATEIISFRLLYANAMITTAYFVTCTWLMLRIGKGSLLNSQKNN